MIFPRRIPDANAFVAALLLFALFHPNPAGAIGRPPEVTVTVEGEVRRPGSYTLPYDATLSTLVVAAGGYTENADLAAATLKRESANPVAPPLSHPRLLKGSPADLPLADGDTLRIPARTPGAPARSRPRPPGAEPFTGPNNFGVTGLLETPTARVMKENRYRLGATQVHPYRYSFGTVGLFDRIEVNLRLNESLGIRTRTGRSSKDKAFDFKFQFLKEDKHLPALSVVVSDPHGTRVYASQAIVASKQIFPFDVSLGFGNGRLGKQPLPAQEEGFKFEMFTDPAKWAREALPFGGIQYAVTPWLSLLAEYSPIRFERQTTDPAQKRSFPTAVRSPFNVGARVKPFQWLEIAASWQRGNELGVSASVAFDIGRPLVPIHDPPHRESVEASRAPLQDRIATALADAGFSDIAVSDDGYTMRVDAQNDRYFFAPRAVEALLSTIAPFVPPNVEHVRVQLKENGIPAAEAAVPAAALSGAGGGFFPTDRIRAAAGYRSANFDAPLGPTTYRRRFDTASNHPSKRSSTTRPGTSSTASAFPRRSSRIPGAAVPRSSGLKGTRSTRCPRPTSRSPTRSAATPRNTRRSRSPSADCSSTRSSRPGSRRTSARPRGCSRRCSPVWTRRPHCHCGTAGSWRGRREASCGNALPRIRSGSGAAATTPPRCSWAD